MAENKSNNERGGMGSPGVLQGKPTDVAPDYYDHSSVLQAVMGMHKSLGGLEAKVDRLQEDVKDQGKKLERVVIIIASASVAITVLLTIGGFLLDKISITF